MRSLDIAKLRVLNQGLGRPEAGSARGRERMGMVQAQDLEMALWAVGCRMRRPSRRAVAEAIGGGGGISFGIYAASPINHSFTACFSDMQVTDCKWLAWSTEDTGFNQTK